MRKAWCDICGHEITNPEDTGIGRLTMHSSYSDDAATKPIHKDLDVCRSCLVYVDALIESRILANKPRGYRGYFEEGEF